MTVIERLEEIASRCLYAEQGSPDHETFKQAADLLRQAERALKPYAKAASWISDEFSDLDSTEFALLEEQQPTVGDHREAARVYRLIAGEKLC